MKTAGEILKEKRRERGIELEEVAEKTRIKKNYLEAVESDHYQSLPSAISARGFIKNYAEFLDLSPESVLGAFKRDFKSSRRKGLLPPKIPSLMGKSKFSWGPKITLMTVILVAVITLLSYLGYQYFSLIKRPSLEVFQPQEGGEFLERTVAVFGRADPDAAVTINNNLVSLSEKGEFHFNLDLLPGENRIVVEATNRLGKKNKLERKVFVKEPD